MGGAYEGIRSGSEGRNWLILHRRDLRGFPVPVLVSGSSLHSSLESLEPAAAASIIAKRQDSGFVGGALSEEGTGRLTDGGRPIWKQLGRLAAAGGRKG